MTTACHALAILKVFFRIALFSAWFCSEYLSSVFDIWLIERVDILSDVGALVHHPLQGLQTPLALNLHAEM